MLREANFCVDKFALLEEPRNELKVLLQNDFMGLAHEHAKLCSFPFPFGLVLISDIPKKKKKQFLDAKFVFDYLFKHLLASNMIWSIRVSIIKKRKIFYTIYSSICQLLH